MLKQRGMAEVLAIVLIFIAFGVGFAVKHISDKKNHPVEEVAEAVLKQQGIDYEFSKESKDSQRK